MLGTLSPLPQRNVDTGMGLERLALFINGQNTVWKTNELHELTVVVGDTLGVDPDQLAGEAQRSMRIVTDHLRASLAIVAAGIAPSASWQGYVLRKLIRRAVRHAELLKGTDQGLAQSLIEATDHVSDVMGRRWKDVGPGEGGDLAKATIEKESSKFSKTLKKGVDHLQELADESLVFDGDLAFRLADTLGYPVELSAEEAQRIGMSIDEAWPHRYEELREEQRSRSRLMLNAPRRTRSLRAGTSARRASIRGRPRRRRRAPAASPPPTPGRLVGHVGPSVEHQDRRRLTERRGRDRLGHHAAQDRRQHPGIGARGSRHDDLRRQQVAPFDLAAIQQAAPSSACVRKVRGRGRCSGSGHSFGRSITSPSRM